MAVELPEGNSSYRRAIFYCKIKKIRVTGGQGEGALQLPEGTAKGRFSCRRASEGIWPPLTQFLRLFVFFGFICFFLYFQRILLLSAEILVFLKEIKGFH